MKLVVVFVAVLTAVLFIPLAVCIYYNADPAFREGVESAVARIEVDGGRVIGVDYERRAVVVERLADEITVKYRLRPPEGFTTTFPRDALVNVWASGCGAFAFTSSKEVAVRIVALGECSVTVAVNTTAVLHRVSAPITYPSWFNAVGDYRVVDVFTVATAEDGGEEAAEPPAEFKPISLEYSFLGAILFHAIVAATPPILLLVFKVGGL